MYLKKLFIPFAFLLISQATLAQVTDDPAANYKAAQALVAAGKGTEAVPYLEQVVKTQNNYAAVSYSMLGSIYDNAKQPEKAIVVYKDGLKAYPQDQSLHFNLGIASFRAKQYAQAELAAIDAIRLDPKHANSQRLYGLVTFHQNKRANALLAFCSFLLLEPNGQRAEEAMTNLQSILKGGVLKADGAKSVSADAKEVAALNSGIASVIETAQTKKLSGNALLEYQLKNIFTLAGQASAKKTNKSFFDTYYADFFYKLAQAGQVPALVKLMVSKEESAAFSEWVKGAERKF